MTLLTKKLLPITLVLVGTVALAACSSKPSPWTESSSSASSSPWEGRSEEAADPEPLAVEDVESASTPEEETIEPVGFGAAEDDSAMLESEDSVAMLEEPMAMDESMNEEPMDEQIEEGMANESAVAAGGGLAAQPAGLFAVQVVASSSMDQLNFFAQQNELSNEWVAETTVDGKVWFVLMSGVYTNKADAEEALTGLQELGTQPWIRTVGSVQSVMN